MSLKIGDAATKKRTTAKFWIAPTDLSLYTSAIGAQLPFRSLGNILDYKRDSGIKTADHSAADSTGFKFLDRSDVIAAGNLYTFKFDEEDLFTRKLIFATQTASSTASQGAHTAPAGTATITNAVTGGSYLLGDYNITTLVVTVSGASPETKVLGVDYAFDAILGMITVLPGGAIASGVDDLICTWGCAAETRDTFVTLTAVQVDAAFRLIEYDRMSPNPRQTITFTGTCWVSSEAESDGDKFSDWELSVRAYTKPVILARQ